MRIHIHPEEIEAARLGIRRSSEWPRVERIHRILQPKCVCCGEHAKASTPVQVHHVFPFHVCVALGRPDLELDQRNLITLCESEAAREAPNHHLLVGHLDDFRSTNLEVLRDARVYLGMNAEQIRDSSRWQSAVARRIKPLELMSHVEKMVIAREMNRRLPKH